MAKAKVSDIVDDKPNSCTFFTLHWLCWKILGVAFKFYKDNSCYILLYLLYSIALNVIVTICYPLHLGLLLFRSELMADNMKNLAICVTCVACSVKFIIYATKLQTVREVEGILKRLDERIANEIEIVCFKRMQRRLYVIGLVFLSVYVPVGITAFLSFIFRDEKSLLYPAWFPFNWAESAYLFILANLYQITGISVLVLQNYADDTFPAMALCMLSGHIQILSTRVANIGYTENSLVENEAELKRCIQDQQTLYDLYATIEDIISWPIFIQFSVSAANICFGISALLFFVSAKLDVLYYFVYCLAMALQIFPTCYYGTDCQYHFGQLHYSIYASNWVDQTFGFKKNMKLFIERSLKNHVALAGGMVRIQLNTFFSACQATYSLLAVIATKK